MRKILIKLFATLCIVTLVFAACSSNDDETDDTTTTTTEAAQELSLVEIAQDNPDFSTLVDLVVKAGLAETLSGGEYTVFAPTNEAFEALGEGTLETLEADADLLQGILTYHAIAGATILSSALEDGQEIEMVNEATVTVSISEDGVVTLTDGSGNEATVIQADITASNGVIHVIDSVLVPEGALS